MDHPERKEEEMMSYIDIGGVSLIRVAAKNHERVTVIVDLPTMPASELPSIRNLALMPRFDGRWHNKAFITPAVTTVTSCPILDKINRPKDSNPIFAFRTYHMNLMKKQSLRYGENKHQQAALYVSERSDRGVLASDRNPTPGEASSFNNLLDASAVTLIQRLPAPACAIVKHINPCGVGVAQDPTTAYTRALSANPQAAFGGVIAIHAPLDETTLNTILEQQFVEVIIAPDVTPAVLDLAKTKPNLRVLTCNINHPSIRSAITTFGGTVDSGKQTHCLMTRKGWQVVTPSAPSTQQQQALTLAWQVVKSVKSNAIVLATPTQTIGIGAGQMSRIDSTRMAIQQAQQFGHDPPAVAASDAFFPF